MSTVTTSNRRYLRRTRVKVSSTYFHLWPLDGVCVEIFRAGHESNWPDSVELPLLVSVELLFIERVRLTDVSVLIAKY